MTEVHNGYIHGGESVHVHNTLQFSLLTLPILYPPSVWTQVVFGRVPTEFLQCLRNTQGL